MLHAVDRDERPDLAGRPERRVVDVDHPSVGHHLRMLEELRRREERVGADVAHGHERVHPRALGAGAHPLAQQALELVGVGERSDPHRRPREPRFVEEVLQIEQPEPRAEVVVLAGAHLDEPPISALGRDEAQFDAALHEVGPLPPQQRRHGPERAELRERRQAARQRQGNDAQPLGAHAVQQRPVRADTDHLMPARGGAAHQGKEEVAEREIDVRDLNDLHAASGGQS